MKLGLATRAKWTSEYDVSQNVCLYIYIYIYIHMHICKSEVSKSYIIAYTYLNFINYCKFL